VGTLPIKARHIRACLPQDTTVRRRGVGSASFSAFSAPAPGITVNAVIVFPVTLQSAVPKLCQNPNRLGPEELLFEREQLPQVVDNKHFRIELIEHLEPVIVIRNQQVAGSIPAGGSSFSIT
jgi:hypothetical protein